MNLRSASGALAIALATCTNAFAAPTRHVLVVSIDGFGASELFEAPSCIERAPTLRRLADEGAYSHGIGGVLPTITYPSHATIVTGTVPARHGIHDNQRGGDWIKQRAEIRADTLWDAARRAGRSVAIVTWPSTYGAQADWLVPEDLANRAVATADIRAGSTPGLFDALAEATGAPQLLPFGDAEAGAPLDAMTGRFAAEIVRRHRPELLLVHFLDYDHRMHASPWSAEACLALEKIDAWIEHILAAYRVAGLGDRTTVFIVSDHGFGKIERRVNPFTQLKEAGWARAFPGLEPESALRVDFAGGSAAFYAASPEVADAGRLEALRARFDKLHGESAWMMPRGRVRALGGSPDAVFVLCARPGFAFTVRAGGPSSGGAHGYCPDDARMNATFIASGYGVRKAGAIGRMPLSDVGPTIGGFLGISPAQATGRDRSSELRSSGGRSPGR